MTARLEQALQRARKLPADEQDRIASLILDEIESDLRWQKLFERSSSKLREMAAAAREEAAHGDAVDHDPADRNG